MATIVHDDHALYVMVRAELASMGAGKAAAQAIHAGHVFVFQHIIEPMRKSKKFEIAADIEAWMHQSSQRAFGTTIVLASDDKRMRLAVEAAKRMGLRAGYAHDDEYPLVDGSALHLIPLDSCGYVFIDRKDAQARFLLSDHDLLGGVLIDPRNQ